ncbi:MAG: hypothetical protein OWT27_05205, partial [Firmicutes bacterium]|nr:hypothetical protein [Bacillota bacterium]
MKRTPFWAGAAAAALALTVLPPVAMAATRPLPVATAARGTLVALGDSITFGYGLQPGDARP